MIRYATWVTNSAQEMFVCDTASNIRVSVSGTVVRIRVRIWGVGYTNVDRSELALL